MTKLQQIYINCLRDRKTLDTLQDKRMKLKHTMKELSDRIAVSDRALARFGKRVNRIKTRKRVNQHIQQAIAKELFSTNASIRECKLEIQRVEIESVMDQFMKQDQQDKEYELNNIAYGTLDTSLQLSQLADSLDEDFLTQED